MNEYASFSDESCTTGHDYMVIGGVTCSPEIERHLITEIDRIHPSRPQHWTYEWKYIRPTNLERYERLVDLFFDYNKEHYIDFRCVVFDCRHFNHTKFNKGDGELGFNKFLYQHLLSHSRAMPRSSRFWCYHHNRNSRYDLDVTREALNAKSFHENARMMDPYREVSYKSLAEKPLLQFADILIGAVGFSWNRKAGLKAKMTRRIAEQACHPLDKQTPPYMRNFNIWEFDLRT